ncbi:MAG TPA: hypothetical protein VHM20_07690, partial [Gammaproteobacteria bacterium]|nr:hypothetical protein [Gammaproteobacteria bacterium]
ESTLAKRLKTTMRQSHPEFENKSKVEQKKIRRETIHQYIPRLLDSAIIEKESKRWLGLTFGFSLIKGASSHLTKNYRIIYLTDTEQTKFLLNIFLKNEEKILTEYQKNKKYLVLSPSDTPCIYQVFYIQNQKLVRRPHYYEPNHHPPKVFIAENSSAHDIIEKCLTSLNLHHSIFINNKSASQNNFSISYNFDFESYVMYLDREKYLEGDSLIPEGNEWGSIYDLNRSIPMPLMKTFANVVYSALNNKNLQQEMSVQQKKWNSWDNPPYHDIEKIIYDYQHKSAHEKWEIFENNIHITLRLYEKTIQIFLKTHGGIVTLEEHPSFKNPYNNFSGYIHYLNILEERIDHLLMSYYHLMQSIKEDYHNLLSRTQFIPQWILNDKRNIEAILEGCKSASHRVELKAFALYERILMMEKKIKNPEKLRNEFLLKAMQSAKKLSAAVTEEEVLHQFIANHKNFFHYIRLACVNDQAIQLEIKNLLQIRDKETDKTILEKSTENHWEKAIALLKVYQEEKCEIYNDRCRI